jgi:signal transduction histidine kinase
MTGDAASAGRIITAATPSPLAALHLLVALLDEEGTAAPSAPFYDHLAEAFCRLGAMRRAAVYLSDVRQHVWAAGSYGVAVERLTPGPLAAIPLALRALDQDEVLQVTSPVDLADELPAGDVARLALSDIACIPLSAGGHRHGVVLAERGDTATTTLTEAEREGLLTLGKMCALAISARAATRQQERARQLSDRLDLARDLHERVVQRLFGVTLALGAPGELTAPQRTRCADELQTATEELRRAIRRPLAGDLRETATTLRDELVRLAAEHADLELTVDWAADAEVPAQHELLAQTVVAEAVRNARKHARPTRIDIRVAHQDGTTTIAVVNDGVGPDAPAGAGVGLRLAAFEALEFGAAVDFGRTPPDRWHVQLVLPLPTSS